MLNKILDLLIAIAERKQQPTNKKVSLIDIGEIHVNIKKD